MSLCSSSRRKGKKVIGSHDGRFSLGECNFSSLREVIFPVDDLLYTVQPASSSVLIESTPCVHL